MTLPNPHAHILITTRPFTKDGFAAKKNRDWEHPQNVRNWRKAWADAQNREFARKGLEVRVSHESNINRGLDREPTIHKGHEVIALERRGIQTEVGDKNRAIMERNAERDERERRRQQERYREIEERVNREFLRKQGVCQRPDRDQERVQNRAATRETSDATPDRTGGTSRDR